jgi:hypothetical protein
MTIKSDVMNQLGYTDQDKFDTMLLNLDINPNKNELNDEDVEKVRQYEAKKKANNALPGSTSGNGHHSESNGQLAPTDDDILELAASTGVELDVVMSAAEHVESLEALVKWVEKYKQLEEEQAIEDSARQQFELDQLRKKEQELGERLNAAINKPAVDVAAIRQRLGVRTPQGVKNLGKWDGKPGSVGEPDFLKNARVAFAKTSS